jgi:hypothetical protein
MRLRLGVAALWLALPLGGAIACRETTVPDPELNAVDVATISGVEISARVNRLASEVVMTLKNTTGGVVALTVACRMDIVVFPLDRTVDALWDDREITCVPPTTGFAAEPILIPPQQSYIIRLIGRDQPELAELLTSAAQYSVLVYVTIDDADIWVRATIQ